MDTINNVADDIISFFEKNDVKIATFYGQMGSGKTTLIKNICMHLGVTDNVTSPTFAIVNEYETKKSDLVYHFDFYRLKTLQEALDIAVEDYLFEDFYCFIEWAELIEPILPSRYAKILISEVDKITREVNLSIVTNNKLSSV